MSAVMPAARNLDMQLFGDQEEQVGPGIENLPTNAHVGFAYAASKTLRDYKHQTARGGGGASLI